MPNKISGFKIQSSGKINLEPIFLSYKDAPSTVKRNISLRSFHEDLIRCPVAEGFSWPVV